MLRNRQFKSPRSAVCPVCASTSSAIAECGRSNDSSLIATAPLRHALLPSLRYIGQTLISRLDCEAVRVCSFWLACLRMGNLLRPACQCSPWMHLKSPDHCALLLTLARLRAPDWLESAHKMRVIRQHVLARRPPAVIQCHRYMRGIDCALLGIDLAGHKATSHPLLE